MSWSPGSFVSDSCVSVCVFWKWRGCCLFVVVFSSECSIYIYMYFLLKAITFILCLCRQSSKPVAPLQQYIIHICVSDYWVLFVMLAPCSLLNNVSWILHLHPHSKTVSDWMHICTEAENIFQTSVCSVILVILIRLMGLCISVFANWVKVPITRLLFTIFSVQKLVNQSFSVHTTEDVKKDR